MSSQAPPSSSEHDSPDAEIPPRAIYQDDGWADDDDMDYEDTNESMDESLGESELDDTAFYDAEQGIGPVEIEFELTEDDEQYEDDSREASADIEEEEEDDEDEEGGQTETEATAQPERPRERQTIMLNQQQILRLLGHAGLRGLFANHTAGTRSRTLGAEDEDDDDDDDGGFMNYSNWGRLRPRRVKRDGPGYPKPPMEEGRKLMESGAFGLNERTDTRIRKKKLAYRTMMRELGLGSAGKQKSANKIMSQSLIPGSAADSIINYNARCYSGQFSDDGNFFFSCAQDFRVRMYDTSNPYKWKYYKTAHYLGGQWTITDATLSPDNKFLAYSSIRSAVCLSPTDPDNTMDPTILEFANTTDRPRRGYYGGGFGIWSLRYSGDGREIVAGTNDESLCVYDIEARRTTLHITGHRGDVNAVCYGDTTSPHILYSGSDDTTIKVWDRRSMGDEREAGALVGHTEGVTYIDSKGDGRYVISNAKDQTMKLWDLRKMMTTERFDAINPEDYTTGFDYRFTPYDEDDYEPHPHDCSVVTFRGHKVLKTLIRCHFSPPGSSDGRYVYSGSYDGGVYVWNLDGTLAKKIDVLAATKNSRPPEDERYVDRWDTSSGRGQWQTIVRDASWHPTAPVLAATSWNGWDHGLGTCSVHTWNDDNDSDDEGNVMGGGVGDECDDPPMGARLTPQLDHDQRYYGSERTRGSTRVGAGGVGGAPRRSVRVARGAAVVVGEEEE